MNGGNLMTHAGRRRVMRRGVVALVVGSGLIAGACGNGDGGSASGDLPLLPFSTASARSAGEESAGAASMAAGDSAATDMAIAPDMYRRVEYRLGDDIKPMGGKAAAYRMEADVDEGQAKQLAAAFGVEGDVREENGGWLVGSKDGARDSVMLAVGPDGSFNYYDGAADTAVATDSATASCSSDGACSTPVVVPEPVRAPVELISNAEAEAKAREVFDDAGVDLGSSVRVERTEYNVFVLFPLSVGGVEVEGLAQTASFGEKGALQYASGTLATPSKIGDYPLVSTKEAFDRAQAGMAGVEGVGRAEPAIDTAEPRTAVSEDSASGGGSSGSAGSTASAGAAEPGVAEPGVAVDEPVADPAGPDTVRPDTVPPDTGPTTTLEPEIRELTEVELVLMPEYPRCPGDAIYLVPAYRFSSGDDEDIYGSIPAVEEEYLASSQTGDDAKSSEELQPCPGEQGESVPGREPDAPPPTSN